MRSLERVSWGETITGALAAGLIASLIFMQHEVRLKQQAQLQLQHQEKELLQLKAQLNSRHAPQQAGVAADPETEEKVYAISSQLKHEKSVLRELGERIQIEKNRGGGGRTEGTPGLEAELKAGAATLEHLNQQLNALHSEEARLTSTIQAATVHEKWTLESSLKAVDSQLTLLQREVATLQGDLNQLRGLPPDYENGLKVAEVSKVLEARQAELKALTDRKELIQEQASREASTSGGQLQQELERVRQAASQIGQTLASTRNRMTVLRQDYETEKAARDPSQRDVQSLEQTYQKQNAKIRELEKKLRAIHQASGGSLQEAEDQQDEEEFD